MLILFLTIIIAPRKPVISGDLHPELLKFVLQPGKFSEIVSNADNSPYGIYFFKPTVIKSPEMFILFYLPEDMFYNTRPPVVNGSALRACKFFLHPVPCKLGIKIFPLHIKPFALACSEIIMASASIPALCASV